MQDVRPGQPDQTVHARVQVVDMNSVTLDLQMPTYLPARDLTQRVARDAGLTAYWEDGKRRLYWLRARGRLLADNETLGDLGVVNGELVYLLPQPPAGSGVEEQEPDYPPNKGYAGKGTLAAMGSVMGVVAWAVGWGAALYVERSSWTVLWPGIGLGFLCISLGRHLWGGRGNQPRIAATGIILFMLLFVIVFLPAVLGGESAGAVYAESVSGFIFGMVGVFLGWLAWWGAVEPLPARAAASTGVAQDAGPQVVGQCGICGLDVTPEVRADCQHACGRVFHTGCYQARLSVYRGDSRFCGVCNARVG